MQKSHVHSAGDLGNSLEVPEHALVTVDMRLENFPVVDARLARRSRVGQHEPGLDLLRRHRHRFAMNAVRIQVNGADSAIERRVVILTAGRNANDLCLDVLSDDSHLLEREIAVGEAGEGSGGGNHERRRAGDARSRRRFGIGLHQQTFLRCKKLQQARCQREAETARPPQLVETREGLFPACVE